ncbi:acyl carrier protein-like [Clytia hemisphaerica]|uniref:Acyl carrier protein n=1 Tax=Clytia hemisphaerica TaxID=252671 RepID=A0A7M5X7A2_9CNID
MAARSGQILRNLIRLAPKNTVTKLSCRAINTQLQCTNKHQILKTLPTIARVSQRFYGDTADDESLEDKTMNVLKLFDKVDPSKVNVEAHLINDLGLDSLDVVEVVMAFEDEFGIEISDEEAEKIFTIRQAVELIGAKM